MIIEVKHLMEDLPSIYKATVGGVGGVVDPPLDDDAPGAIPAELRRWLVRLRLLEGVPFANLVADTELLPEESIRWFYLDRRWTDAVVQGALSAGTVNSDDRVQLTAQYDAVRDELDVEERNARREPGSPRFAGSVEAISGFILRSRAVSGWPGLHVRAFSVDPTEADDATYPEVDPRRMRLLRMERLAPAVLLVLFDGVPAVVHVEEPRQGVQFGFDVAATGGQFTATFRARDRDTFEDLPGANQVVTVPFRSDGAAGVVDIQAIERELALPKHPNTGAGDGLDAAEYALQLIRFPYRQVFGDAETQPGNVPIATVFQPAISYATQVKKFVAMKNPDEVATMSDIPFKVAGTVLKDLAYGQRWAALAAAEVDLATFETWDKHLPRDRRILVPVDVQAFVAPTGGSDPVVAVAGRTGDPAPFDAGTPLTAGVHLHWAMPDALLRGATDPTTGDLKLPALPDRWVVIRHLYPVGSRSIHVTGWVIDATTGVVTSLLDYSGATTSAPEAETFVPLDGFRGGSPLWTAAYAASRNRFALHDPLADLAGLAPAAPQGWDGGRAAYTVAGWWSGSSGDPLAAATGPTDLRRIMAELGWALGREGEDSWDEPPDPRVNTLVRRMGLTSGGGTGSTTMVRKYGTTTVRDEDVAPTAGLPVRATERTFIGVAPTRYHALCHGSVLGVPIDGSADGLDERPLSEALGASAGLDLDDVAAAFAAPGLAAGLGLTPEQRQFSERLVAAFTAGTLAELGAQDGLADLEEREHADGFWSLSGPPVEGSHDDVVRAEDSSPFGPTRVGRKGRGAMADSGFEDIEVEFVQGVRIFAAERTTKARADGAFAERLVAVDALRNRRTRTGTPRPSPSASAPPTGPTARTVPKAPPRRYRPAPLMVAISGVKPNQRHHGDGLHDGGVLRCRYPGEVVSASEGVVEGGVVAPTLGNGAIPPEVTRLVREATLLDGYHHGWLAAAGATNRKELGPVHVRLVAELTRIHGADAAYDGTGIGALTEIAHRADTGTRRAGDAAGRVNWTRAAQRRSPAAVDGAAELAAYSVLHGTPPSPVAITNWRQPWVPLFLEWRVRLDGAASLDGWTLGSTDLAGAQASSPLTRTYAGRSPLHRGVGDALSEGIREWLDAEDRRDQADPSSSQLEDADEVALGDLANLLDPLDLASASLDGLREQLLGIRYEGIVVRDEDTKRPVADQLPVPIFGGTATIVELRLVDAFGRTLAVPVDDVLTTTQLDTGTPGELRLTPRIQNAARWLFRLVDPAHPLEADPAKALEAWVDQVHPDVAVNPVCGYLLPDHMDESLEVFDRNGDPIGELTHDSVSDAVTWEPAPGRPIPPDAGPLAELPTHAQHVGLFADGVVRADIAGRHAAEAPGESSALTALLRAVDSTLWTVDAFSALGTPTIAGLVGRPIAVVRATLRLDAPDDVDEVTITAGGGGGDAVAARRAAYAELSRHRFPVRIGELGRSDDAVLGFFVDDDYTHFHVVDKVVAGVALDSGRHRGQLGLLGDNDLPAVRPLEHPYLELEDTVEVRVGETRRLTILMLPGGKVHLTSGILPRKSLGLADEWVSPGLRRLVPSLRTGPVLVDPAQIRLPKVASFGPDQQFTRRTGPLTWRDDPIIAASTSAYLPPMPHEAQEGWIRVAPKQPGAPGAPPAGGAP